MNHRQDQRRRSKNDPTNPVNAEDDKKSTDVATCEMEKAPTGALDPERPKLDESLIVYSLNEVCKMLGINCFTLKRLIIHLRIPVEFCDLDFGHVQYGTLDEWPRTEASHAIMIRKPDLETMKSFLSAHGENPDSVTPVALPTAGDHGRAISPLGPRRTRGRDKSYDEVKKICMPLLRNDFRREKPFRPARQLHERVMKKLKGDSPSERSISRWMCEWIEEIQKDE